MCSSDKGGCGSRRDLLVRTAELLKVASSGRGVVLSCNTVVPPGRGVARRRGECWSVAASGGGRETYSAGDVNARRWGMSADLPSGAAAGFSSGGAWSSDGAVN